MDYHIIIFIFLYLSLLFVFPIIVAYSQKEVNWQSYPVRNHSSIIIPSTDNSVKKVYDVKPLNYTTDRNLSQSSPINNTISFIITNATITVNEKIDKGSDISIVNQTFAKPTESILLANK